MQTAELTFDAVDDLCFGLQNGKLDPTHLPRFRATALGPLFEFAHVHDSLVRDGGRDAWLDASAYECLRVDNSSRSRAIDASAGRMAVSALASEGFAWTHLSIQAKRAAIHAGFSNDTAGQLTAAIQEIYSNVMEHSENIRSGYVAYSARAGYFEFVVADKGVGVLNSLRMNDEYRELGDHGTALELALSEGVSRHGTGTGHGYGFRPLLTGLANISRTIRFRSGDHSREISRLDDGEIISRTIQKVTLPGFFCSVTCDR